MTAGENTYHNLWKLQGLQECAAHTKATGTIPVCGAAFTGTFCC